MLDELREHQDFQAWGAISKTTMARPDAIIWCMSNAGDGTSVVLRHLRQKAHALIGDPDGIVAALADSATGDDEDEIEDDSIAIFEWSAPPDAAPSDPEAWAAANPSLGYTITERAMKSAYTSDTKDVFLTECLCQWVTAAIDPPFPADAWEAGKDEMSKLAPDAEMFFGNRRVRRSHEVIGLRVAASGLTVSFMASWPRTEAAPHGLKTGFVAVRLSSRSRLLCRRAARQLRPSPTSSMRSMASPSFRARAKTLQLGRVAYGMPFRHVRRAAKATLRRCATFRSQH